MVDEFSSRINQAMAHNGSMVSIVVDEDSWKNPLSQVDGIAITWETLANALNQQGIIPENESIVCIRADQFGINIYVHNNE